MKTGTNVKLTEKIGKYEEGAILFITKILSNDNYILSYYESEYKIYTIKANKNQFTTDFIMPAMSWEDMHDL